MSNDLVTFAVNPDEVAPAAGSTSETAERFRAMTRNGITPAMTAAMGYDFLQSAVGTLQAELADHDERILTGLGSDADRLGAVVRAYGTTDSTLGGGFDQLRQTVPDVR